MNEKTLKEINDVMEKFHQLEEQKRNPSKQGMIKALLEAKAVASAEISALETSQGDTVVTPAYQISDEKLYWKLTQYQQGLINHCINKYGEETVKKYLENLQNQIKGQFPNGNYPYG